MLCFFSSLWNWDSPNPSPAREYATPPPLWFRGEGTHTVVLFICMYFVGFIIILSYGCAGEQLRSHLLLGATGIGLRSMTESQQNLKYCIVEFVYRHHTSSWLACLWPRMLSAGEQSAPLHPALSSYVMRLKMPYSARFPLFPSVSRSPVMTTITLLLHLIRRNHKETKP